MSFDDWWKNDFGGFHIQNLKLKNVTLFGLNGKGLISRVNLAKDPYLIQPINTFQRKDFLKSVKSETQVTVYFLTTD